MKLRIWCVSSIEDSLKGLVHKWHLKRTPIRDCFDGDRTYSKDTGNCFEYWIELNTLEELFALQKDLYKENGFNNELVISKWAIGEYKNDKYHKLDEGFGLKVYNECME